MNPHPQPLWTVHDVATYLGVPVMTIYHWRRTGYGPGTRVGRHLRYRPEDVRIWLDNQRHETSWHMIGAGCTSDPHRVALDDGGRREAN